MTEQRYIAVVLLIALFCSIGIGATAYGISKSDNAFKRECRQAGGVPVINRAVRMCYASNAVIEIK